MALDLDNIAPATDPDTVDLSADRGDALLDDELPTEEPTEAPTEEPTEAPTEAAADEEEGAPPRDEKGRFAGIPKARFDEAVGKEREAREAAERRAAELERQLGQNQQAQVRTAQIDEIEAQISSLEKQHADLLLDGEAEKAAAVMKEIRMSERQIARMEADTVATQRTTQALEAERVEVAIARLEADFPEMNPDSEVYDPDLVELVLSKQRSLIQAGHTPSKALTSAATAVAERFLKREEVADAKGLAAAKPGDRKTAQVQKNLDTQKRQPASMKDSGMDSDKAGHTGKIDVTKLTQAEYDALPAATIARLRGDMV